MSLRAALLILLTLLFIAPSHAEEEPWQRPRPLDGLYERIAEDLKAGEPLIITSYYGMWHVRSAQPERNLNWGGMFGHATMLKKARRDEVIKRHFLYPRWTLVYEAKAEVDPLRTLVFTQKVRPNKRWRRLGVKAPFKVYLVMMAYASQTGAGLAMVRGLRQDKGPRLTLKDGVKLEAGVAQVTGYFGHNFFYDYENFFWRGFREIEERPARAKGVFAVGCKTARVPGFKQLITEPVYAYLYSKTLMGSEGYSTLALADGLLAQLSSAELVRHADKTYRDYQHMTRPNRRVGRPFVSHDKGVFP